MVWGDPAGAKAASPVPGWDPLVPGGATTVDSFLRNPPARLPRTSHVGADSGIAPGNASNVSQLTVSALIVSWNSLALIRSCIESLGRQTAPPRQVVVVDNGSTDGSVAWLREQPNLQVIESKTNLGFAAANNLGLRACRESTVLCINPDVVLDPGYVEFCLRHLARPDVGSVTGKLLRASPVDIIDSTGHAVYGIGWAENRGELSPDGPSFAQAQEVFGVCAAAGLYRVGALHSVRIEGQVFDETYFSYIEDVDLDWRLRWAGWRAWYEPLAVAVHHRSASGARFSAPVMRHIVKNRLLTVVKNYDRSWLLREGVGLAAFTTIKTADFGLRHPSAVMGLVDFARLVPEAMRKRRAVKSLRRTPSSEMRTWLLRFPWRERTLRRIRGQGRV
jgi:GT2 family glycosyltransferase